ncbi:MAG: FAD-dependent oxidoreductase [Candidatus Falkowbacteria bacterium]|nr:FAD-dependent oxidoreductase [Candidatus Falkowbacteria bacterium]
MYDTIIIGSGPAGMTAGIYAVRREMKALVIGKELGGQLVWANEIENYPGFKKINAFELIQNMKDQALSFGVEMRDGEVKKIEKTENNTFLVYFGAEEVVEGKTIILTIGLSPRRLAIKGEEEFSGKGVSYCANCDGPFFRNKKVAVVGSGNSAFDAAEVLSKIASEVYLLVRNESSIRAFDSLVNEIKSRSNIKLLLNSVIEEIVGDSSVKKINCANIKENNKFEIEVDGVFVEIGRIAHTDLVAELVDRTPDNRIMVSKDCATKTPGIFAAGDVSDLSEFKQISIATGQATIAALSAYKYLQP